MPDGDFVDLAWSENPAQAQHKPRLVVFHGLEGSLNSPYAHGLQQQASAKSGLEECEMAWLEAQEQLEQMLLEGQSN